jgi:hypothetical protein
MKDEKLIMIFNTNSKNQKEEKFYRISKDNTLSSVSTMKNVKSTENSAKKLNIDAV